MAMSEKLVYVLVLFGAALVASGCANPLHASIVTANTAGAALAATHATLLAASQQAQRDAARRVKGSRALASVRQEQRDRATMAGNRFRKVWGVYSTCRTLWATAVAAIKVASETQTATGAVDTANVVRALTQLAEAQARLYRLTDEHAGLPANAPPKAP